MTAQKNYRSSIFKQLKIRFDQNSANPLDQDSVVVAPENQVSINNSDLEFKSQGTHLTGYSKIQELKLVKIGIASPDQIMSWAEKTLPTGKVFGEVLNANTLHYKTFKPQKGGLFCQRIFGPLKDFECACGIIRKPASDEGLLSLIQDHKPKRTYCKVCEVEYTWSVIRRYQLGYIKLASPVTHLWYLKANPSYLSMLLDFRKKELEEIIYCTQILTLEDYWRPRESSEIEFNPNFGLEAYKKYLYGPGFGSNLGSTNPFKQRQMKKKLNQQKKRRAFKVQRNPLSFVYFNPVGPYNPSDEPSVPLLASRPIQDQIKSLESAYRLSSVEPRAQKLTRIQNMARLLVSRKIATIQKGLISEAKHQALTQAYQNYSKTFSIYSRVQAQKLQQHKKLNPDGLKSLGNQVRFKQGFSKLTTSSLKTVVKTYLEKLPTVKQRSLNEIQRSLRWSLGANYSYKGLKNKAKTNSMKTNSHLGIFEGRTSEEKNAFLIFFLNLIRKSNPAENWDSIYQCSTEAWETFENSKAQFPKSFVSKTSLKLLKPTFSNTLGLSLLYVLQKRKGSTFNASFLNILKQRFLEYCFEDKVFLQEEMLNLRSMLTSEDIFNLEKKSKTFFEASVLNRNSKFQKFERLVSKNLVLFYLVFLIFKRNQCEGRKKFRIFFKTQSQDIEIRLFQRSLSRFAQETKGKFPPVVLKAFQENYHKNLERLIQTKRIPEFLKNQSIYPEDLKSYLRNKENIRQSLIMFKQNKPSPAFQLFNKLYTVSYSESWQLEKDWKYFLYYSKAATEFEDWVSCFYACRFYGFVDYNVPEVRSSFPILGANIVQRLLLQYEGFELTKMAKQVQNVLPKLNRSIRYKKQKAFTKTSRVEVQRLLQTRDDLIRRLKLLRKLFKKKTKTSSMVLNTVPVLPPDLRPILKMQNQIAASDLNRFYQRILYRNDRLKKFMRANAALMTAEPAFEVKYAQRLLQEAVDNLIQNGKGQVKPETNSRGQPLKSLSEILKGKQGRFRQYLLGKRVDYSGRSVIVVGPALKIYECGLPFEMAMELFLPFLIKRIFQYNLARTVMGAKTILKYDRKTTWHLLEEIMQHHPILLNRAPTLHRLGIQAFQPKLINGRAILLHPMVCPAFNADFDGDQMAVHVPITVEARTEAWKLMFSRNHLVSPATGDPMLLPTQDMVLGCYYLTTTGNQVPKYNWSYPFALATSFYFSNMKQILQAYLQEKIHLQTPVWLRWDGVIQFDQSHSQPEEFRVCPDGSWIEIQPEYHRTWTPTGKWSNLFVRTTAGRIIFNLMIQQCLENKI